MTQDDPLVSVLTPSFNQGRWLADCLDSVRNQTYRRIEHIVVDGASEDRTLEILKAHTRPGLNVLSEPDGGQGDALNKALSLSQGDIVGWVNADDAYFHTRVVERVVRFFEKNPDVDVAYGHAALVNADGLILHMIWRPPHVVRALTWWNANLLIQPAVFFRRRVIQPKFIDEQLASAVDHELWLRIAQRVRFGRLSEVLAIDRHHLERKVVARPDLANADKVRLAQLYGAKATRDPGVGVTMLSALFRLAGVALLPAARQSLAFDGSSGGGLQLARRQLSVRRAKLDPGARSSPGDLTRL